MATSWNEFIESNRTLPQPATGSQVACCQWQPKKVIQVLPNFQRRRRSIAGMQFFVADKNVRVFASSIAYLSKIGKEIAFEGSSDAVVLRALNDSRSSFAAVTFKRGSSMGNCAADKFLSSSYRLLAL